MPSEIVARRSFLARLGFGAAAVPALAAAACAPAAAPAAPAAPMDELETWLAGIKGTQKVIYDCVMAGGGMDGVLYARNFMTLSQEKLKTADADMGVIISFWHLKKVCQRLKSFVK